VGDPLLRALFHVHGRVQGVGFRAWVRREATGLGLRGEAHNEADGSVRVSVQGPPERVERLAELLAKGPYLARVDRVERSDLAEDVPPGFEIR
jgi:acylphosphatase